jgi:hypothetical protein
MAVSPLTPFRPIDDPAALADLLTAVLGEPAAN